MQPKRFCDAVKREGLSHAGALRRAGALRQYLRTHRARQRGQHSWEAPQGATGPLRGDCARESPAVRPVPGRTLPASCRRPSPSPPDAAWLPPRAEVRARPSGCRRHARARVTAAHAARHVRAGPRPLRGGRVGGVSGCGSCHWPARGSRSSSPHAAPPPLRNGRPSGMAAPGAGAVGRTLSASRGQSGCRSPL